MNSIKMAYDVIVELRELFPNNMIIMVIPTNTENLYSIKIKPIKEMIK